METQLIRPDDFVNVQEVIPSVLVDLRYGGAENFLSRPVKGYNGCCAWLAEKAAIALAKAHAMVAEKGYTFVIYDAYRPVKAVQDFMAWKNEGAQNGKTVQRSKRLYYPEIAKETLFAEGYLATYSGHSRGSTVDLTLLSEARREAFLTQPPSLTHQKLSDGRTLSVLDDHTEEMGGHFDLFDLASHQPSALISQKAQEKRDYLRQVMEQCGFKGISTEWWHFTLKDEPYPQTQFDFDIVS